MKFRFLTYLLLALMAVQAVVAVADVHSAHQLGIEHVSVEDHADEHEHSSHEITGEGDCHCCQCHGQTTPAILTDSLTLSYPNRLNNVSTYLVDTPQEPLADFLRPPISKA